MLRGRPDPKKEEQERLQGFLLEMLKEEENKYCADCQAKTPRWAAWNLGIFICIRCAGIHRNLGVHISKVRSVNLDSWSAEQVQTMRVMGNEKARQVYEKDLPAQFRRPTSDSQMEQFIRSKYEQKRYMLRDFVYPKVDVADLPKSLAQLGNKKSAHPVVSIATNSRQSSNANTTNGSSGSSSATVNDLLDFSAPPSSASTTAKTTTNSMNLLDDLAGLSMTQTSAPVPSVPSAAAAADDDFDDFGSFVSASTVPATVSTNLTDSFGGEGFADFSSAPTTASTNTSALADLTLSPPDNNGIEKKKSNADILSLFASSGNSAPIVAPGGFAAFGLQAGPQTQQPAQQPPIQNQNASNDLFGGLGGINFGAPQQPVMQQNVQQHHNSMNVGFGIGTGPVMAMSSQGQNNQFGGFGANKTTTTPASPTSSPGFSIPNKSNAFADLALGKVMKTNYGQSALNTSSNQSFNTRVSPIPSFNSPVKQQTSQQSPQQISNDMMFDIFASAPPPISVNSNASSGLDDLLGL